ncbi:MAG: hypothetical protein M0019_08910 [Actinomycetota bacterium]|nr:hypothetical protein [Actinomycetota bacterium]
MAFVTIEDQTLTVKLSLSEKVESLRFHDLEFKLSNIDDVYVTQRPFDELSGLRVGTGLPNVLCVGTWYSADGAIFAAIHGITDGLVVSLKNERISKIVITTDNALETAHAIRQQI